MLLYIAVQPQCLSQGRELGCAQPSGGPAAVPSYLTYAGDWQEEDRLIWTTAQRHLSRGAHHTYLICYLLDLQGIHPPSFQPSNTVAIRVTKPSWPKGNYSSVASLAANNGVVHARLPMRTALPQPVLCWRSRSTNGILQEGIITPFPSTLLCRKQARRGV